MTRDQRFYTGVARTQRSRNGLRHAYQMPMEAGLTYVALCGVKIVVDDIGSDFDPGEPRSCATCRRYVRNWCAR